MVKVLLCLCLLTVAAFAAPKNRSSLRIVGGHDAAPGQFPYQVSLQSCILGALCSHSCGATILSQNWILTAAHCISTSTLYTYRAIVGINNLQENSATRQQINVQSFIVHPNYVNDGNVGPDDIALMRLSQPIQYSDNVHAASLPNANANPTGNADLSGWGAMAGNQMPNNLQTVSIPILTITQCLNALQNILPGYDIPLDLQGNVCTGPLTGGISACSGDSGGPLAKYGVVVGVVSWGVTPCGSNGAPSVFVKVSHYINWISQHVHDVKIADDVNTVDVKLSYY